MSQGTNTAKTDERWIRQLAHWVIYLTIGVVGLLATAGWGFYLQTSTPIQEWDMALLARVNGMTYGFLDPLTRIVSIAFSPLGALACVVLAVIVIALATRRLGDGLFAGFTIGVVYAVTYGLKMLVGRPRPTPDMVQHVVNGLDVDTSSGYPSGHVAIIAALAVVVFLVARRWGRIVVGVIGALLVAVVAFTRVYAGAHFPNDVIASMVFALTVGPLVYVALYALDSKLGVASAIDRLGGRVSIFRRPVTPPVEGPNAAAVSSHIAPAQVEPQQPAWGTAPVEMRMYAPQTSAPLAAVPVVSPTDLTAEMPAMAPLQMAPYPAPQSQPVADAQLVAPTQFPAAVQSQGDVPLVPTSPVPDWHPTEVPAAVQSQGDVPLVPTSPVPDWHPTEQASLIGQLPVMGEPAPSVPKHAVPQPGPEVPQPGHTAAPEYASAPEYAATPPAAPMVVPEPDRARIDQGWQSQPVPPMPTPVETQPQAASTQIQPAAPAPPVAQPYFSADQRPAVVPMPTAEPVPPVAQPYPLIPVPTLESTPPVVPMPSLAAPTPESPFVPTAAPQFAAPTSPRVIPLASSDVIPPPWNNALPSSNDALPPSNVILPQAGPLPSSLWTDTPQIERPVAPPPVPQPPVQLSVEPPRPRHAAQG